MLKPAKPIEEASCKFQIQVLHRQ